MEVFGGSLISVDGNQKSGKLPVEGNGSLSYYFQRVLYIPGGAGFLPSAVSVCLSAKVFFVNVKVFFSVMVVLSLCDLLVSLMSKFYVLVCSGQGRDGMDCHPFFASFFFNPLLAFQKGFHSIS